MAPQFYLKTLVIQNFATFKNQAIEFEKGVNAIIGETGSGKSLVLEAIELILGGRADKKIVRKGTDTACIEARFTCSDPSIHKFFTDNGFLTQDHEIIIKRLISKTGSTKNFLNHQSCNVSTLAHFARTFIDIVGQFDNQKLLSDQYQLTLLDQFARNELLITNYQNILFKYKETEKQITDLINSQSNREQRLDYLNYQIDEINKLNPSSQDEEELIRKKNQFLNFEKSQRTAIQIDEIFEGNDSALGLSSLFNTLSSLVLKNPDLLQDYSEKCLSIKDDLENLRSSIASHLEQDLNEEEFENVLERLDLYQKLKKKFSGSVEGILLSQVEFLKEKKQLDEIDINLQSINDERDKLLIELKKISDHLHKKRRDASPLLADALTKKIRHLNMAGATINIQIEELSEFNDFGQSKVSFIAETNKGEGFFKIKDIASGGELSRILLSVRQVLSKHDSIGIFLFDEIDTGIGGETAITIGRALQEVGEHGQVIAITHLPQIAQFATNLVLVQKKTQDSDEEIRTESMVRTIQGKNIQNEVKAMVNLQ